ncbi:MAG: MmcQ/YjbR family DNA-binding protein [Chloroflexi bacterium]|nr:MmcQ/YjbR family DNA-binding protein [Chloroflexota bacterium]
MKWAQVVKLALGLPEVAESTWFGTPSLKVLGKGFVRLKDEDTIVLLVDSVDEQELLMRLEPEVYFITDHYRGWPAVLARLSALRTPGARARLEAAWRVKAPRSLVRARDAPAASPAPTQRRPVPQSDRGRRRPQRPR